MGRGRPPVKLDEVKVLEIRSKLASGFSHRRIAYIYGISPSYVHKISTGKSWKLLHTTSD
jgi:hypothetical protein